MVSDMEDDDVTKNAFLAAYRTALVAAYPWAADVTRLNRFMASCVWTLEGPSATWNHDGEAVVSAWKSIGGKGRPTLKALRALPSSVESTPD